MGSEKRRQEMRIKWKEREAENERGRKESAVEGKGRK